MEKGKIEAYLEKFKQLIHRLSLTSQSMHSDPRAPLKNIEDRLWYMFNTAVQL